MLRSPRQEDLKEELGISSSTVVDWFNFCREVIYFNFLDNLFVNTYTLLLLLLILIFCIFRSVRTGPISIPKNLAVQDVLLRLARQELNIENTTMVDF